MLCKAHRLWSEIFANENAVQELQQQRSEEKTPLLPATATGLLTRLIAFLTEGRFEALLAALQVTSIPVGRTHGSDSLNIHRQRCATNVVPHGLGHV